MDVQVLNRADCNAPDFSSEAGFRRIWARHVGELRGFAIRRLSDPGRAEDAVQEAFLRVWRRGGFDATRGTPRVWLFAILRNVLVDYARADKTRPQTVRTAVEVVSADDHERRIAALVVGQALQRLSAEHRVAIVESYYRQRTASEVSEELGVPVGTVRSRLFYGLKALGAALDELGFER